MTQTYLSSSRPGRELFTAYRTFDVVEIDPPYIGGRNHPTALWTDGIEGCPHLCEIDLPGHARLASVAWECSTPFLRLDEQDIHIVWSVHR